jgi:hypothetical protein
VEAVRNQGGNISCVPMFEVDDRLDEVPGAGHWFDGVMTSGSVGEFLRNVSSIRGFPRPVTKSFVIANPREMGERGDIQVEQLMSWQTFALYRSFSL